jgi:hypothetical protein
MSERRNATRNRSFLQGRIYYNHRRSSVDCLVRDVSEHGAKLVFPGAVSLPDVVELHVSNKADPQRARVQWRKGNEMGVAFGSGDEPGELAAMTAPADLAGRVLRLENECAALKRIVNELRAEIRKRASESV